MKRAIGTMFLIPMLLSFAFGPVALIALPVMLIVVAVTALPMFFLLKNRKLLNWWHVVCAGGVCSFLATWAYFSMGNPSHTAFAGPSNSALFLALGLTGSAIYWWIGIFRNEAFEFVPDKSPIGMIVLLPVILGLFYYNKIMVPVEGPTGCIEEQRNLPNPTLWRHAEIEVSFPDSRSETFTLTQGYAHSDLVGQCAGTWQRPTVWITGTRLLYSGVSTGQCGVDC